MWREWTPEEEDRLIAMRDQKMQRKDIAKALGRTRDSVNRRIKVINWRVNGGANKQAPSIIAGSTSLRDACLGYFEREAERLGSDVPQAMRLILGAEPARNLTRPTFKTCSVERLAA